MTRASGNERFAALMHTKSESSATQTKFPNGLLVIAHHGGEVKTRAERARPTGEHDRLGIRFGDPVSDIVVRVLRQLFDRRGTPGVIEVHERD